MGNDDTKDHLKDRIALRKVGADPAGASSDDNMVVVARNPAEMQVAQTKLITWAARMREQVSIELAEAEENLAQAVKNKWRQTGFKTCVKQALERSNYYEKVEAALQEGFVIVPNFDLDIFAIRTTQDEPNMEHMDRRWGKPHPSEFENKSDRPVLGDGEYKNPWPELVHSKSKEKDHNDSAYTNNRAAVVGWQPVDFPFKIVKPQILTDTARALAMNIFDEVGVTPHRQVRKQDPMVIGQIVYKKNSSTEKRISFLVTWWVDHNDIEV
jgi:hypothetical protein